MKRFSTEKGRKRFSICEVCCSTIHRLRCREQRFTTLCNITEQRRTNEAMAKPTFQGTRNKEVVQGVGRHSRSSVCHKRGLWAIKAKNGGSFPSHHKQASETLVSERPPKFYLADDVPKHLRNKRVLKPTKLRSSITPGTVLNLLVEHFKGKRVVFLMQLNLVCFWLQVHSS